MNKGKVAVLTLGCKVNAYESESLMKDLKNRGFSVTNNLEFADYYIINTCAVTSEAEKKSRQMISRAKSFNNDAKIYVCGCASQNNAKQFENENVKVILGVAKKYELPEIIENNLIKQKVDLPLDYEDNFNILPTKARTYIKIQDGCNKFCTYCLIPYIRGRSRSRSIDSIVKEINEIKNDTQEIVLTGIDISDYKENNQLSLPKLLLSLKDIDCRIRLGSLEVGVITKELLDSTLKLKNFCPHFHLSLQSGSLEVLKSMNRRYTPLDYLEKINLIRSYYKDAGITTDLIVGFPTETEQNFEETISFIQKVDFSEIHIFPYSQRKGTVACKYKILDPKIVKEREEKVKSVALDMQNKFLSKFINKEIEVLIDEKDDNYFYGFTPNYLKVCVKKLCEVGKTYKLIPNKIENYMLIVE
jgi:threonylcarbamoyladenosine tRNA methylthiotransferase MtaB